MHSGFNLIEMLVVVAIIGILASLLMPSLQGALSQARRLSCLNNLKQQGVGIITYANDNNGAGMDKICLHNWPGWNRRVRVTETVGLGQLYTNGYMGDGYTVIYCPDAGYVKFIDPNSASAVAGTYNIWHQLNYTAYNAKWIKNSSYKPLANLAKQTILIDQIALAWHKSDVPETNLNHGYEYYNGLDGDGSARGSADPGQYILFTAQSAAADYLGAIQWTNIFNFINSE